MRAVKEIILGIVSLYSSLLVFGYFWALWAKIVEPNVKNMNSQEAIWLGLIALILIIMNYFLFRRWISKSNRTT